MRLVARAQAEADPGRLLLRLARCLEVEELELAILEALVERLPGATALVSLGGPSRVPSRVRDQAGIRLWDENDPVPPLLAAPIADLGETLGWAAFADEAGFAVAGSTCRAIVLEVAAAAGIPARNVRRHAEAIELSLKDPLTGLFNRRALEAFLARESEWARRYDRPLAMVLLDLDRFKSINDSYGHPAGDRALRLAADVISGAMRKSDIIARLGGDEFAAILPGSDADNARRLASRIQQRLTEAEFSPDGAESSLRLEVSFGAADLKSAANRTDKLIEFADRALLDAKRQRRRDERLMATDVDGLPVARRIEDENR